MKQIIIAIDGYSSTGKSTLAKTLAKRLSYKYIDTGAMYRVVALFALRNEIGIEETYFENKRITNKLYFNLVGQEISHPSQIGVYIQKTIFEDGTFESQKMMLTNTKH